METKVSQEYAQCTEQKADRPYTRNANPITNNCSIYNYNAKRLTCTAANAIVKIKQNTPACINHSVTNAALVPRMEYQ